MSAVLAMNNQNIQDNTHIQTALSVHPSAEVLNNRDINFLPLQFYAMNETLLHNRGSNQSDDTTMWILGIN